LCVGLIFVSVKRVVAILAALAVCAGVVVFIMDYQALNYHADEGEIEELRASVRLPLNFLLIASPDCCGQNANTEEAVREGIFSGANCLELNLAFREDGTPVLAKSNKYATDLSYTLEAVLEKIADRKDMSLMINLNEFSNLDGLYALLTEHGLLKRTFAANVDENTSPYVARQYPELQLVYDVSRDADTSSEKACAKALGGAYENGAAGIRCNIDQITEEFKAYLADKTSLNLYVTGADTEYKQYLALSLNPAGIRTENPDMLYQIMIKENYFDR